MKYIDAEKLTKAIEDKGLDCSFAMKMERLNTLALIDELQQEQIDMGEVSDGYHTFNELYYYRMLYNAAFFNLLPKEWVHKSKRHHNGEECFGGCWFIVMANLPTGQVSNHYELKDWDLFKVPEKEFADEWDGHTPQEAAERIKKYLQLPDTLEDKIKRATESWKGVDVDEFMDEVRGREQEQPDKYETALEKAREWMPNVNQGGHAILIDIFPELGEGLDPRYGGRKQEHPEVDLEKACLNFGDEIGIPVCKNFRRIACHFAEWGAERQKEQMLKNAVEGEVIKTDKHTSVRYKSFYRTDRYFYGIADKQFKPGDKVRIIVLPIDELLQRQGYEHAERGLVLTIEDMKRIHTFLYAIKNNKQGCFTFTRLSDDQYTEVLRRFNELGKTRKED